MATYSTTEEVKAEFKELNTTATGAAITNAKIDAWREQAFALINARIGNKYQTPISEEAECSPILKMVELWLVKHRINQVATVRTSADDSKQPGQPESFHKRAMTVLEDIVSGKMSMAGATLRSSADGVSSFNVDEGNEHTVKKDEDQW